MTDPESKANATAPVPEDLSAGESASEPCRANAAAATRDRETSAETIDVAKLDAVSRIELESSPWQIDDGVDAERNAEQLDEIAEDMLDLLRSIRNVEQGQAQIFEFLERLTRSRDQTHRTHIVELDALRRDLLSERRAFATRSTFNTVVGSIDALRAMHEGLDAELDQRTIAQLCAITSSLTNVVQGLGFIEFKVPTGKPFDPATMECINYEEGQQGVVLKVVRPGYRAGELIVRPCGIAMAEPTSEILKNAGEKE